MLAIPAGIVYAQATTTASPNPVPYLPLFSSGGNAQPGVAAGNNAANSAWFIDTTRNQVVLCSQSAATAANTAPAFTCTAEAVPTSPSVGTSSDTSITGTTGSATGGAGLNPMTGQ
jgi:hypothetical protein